MSYGTAGLLRAGSCPHRQTVLMIEPGVSEGTLVSELRRVVSIGPDPAALAARSHEVPVLCGLANGRVPGDDIGAAIVSIIQEAVADIATEDNDGPEPRLSDGLRLLFGLTKGTVALPSVARKRRAWRYMRGDTNAEPEILLDSWIHRDMVRILRSVAQIILAADEPVHLLARPEASNMLVSVYEPSTGLAQWILEGVSIESDDPDPEWRLHKRLGVLAFQTLLAYKVLCALETIETTAPALLRVPGLEQAIAQFRDVFAPGPRDRKRMEHLQEIKVRAAVEFAKQDSEFRAMLERHIGAARARCACDAQFPRLSCDYHALARLDEVLAPLLGKISARQMVNHYFYVRKNRLDG